MGLAAIHAEELVVTKHRLHRHGFDALAPWCLWDLGLITAFYPALRSGFERLQIERGDPRLIQYLLEHSWRFVERQPLHAALWDRPFFHPASGAGAYTDTMLGAVAPYGLFRVLGWAPGAAFQLWMMTCLSLAFLATYLLLGRGLGLGRWASATGAPSSPASASPEWPTSTARNCSRCSGACSPSTRCRAR